MSENGHGPVATPGKYLTFRVGGESYGLEILRVQEIIGVLGITRVPSMPESIRGVINLRGKVIPVVDLRVKFGVAEVVDHDRNCIIVMQVDNDARPVVMGALVDAVSEVVDVAEGALEATPDFGGAVDASFLTGVATHDDTVTMLLDADRLLAATDLDVLPGVRPDEDAA